jgi:hypothetical protein
MVQGVYLGLLVDIHIFDKVVHAENFKHKVDCDDDFFLSFKMCLPNEPHAKLCVCVFVWG